MTMFRNIGIAFLSTTSGTKTVKTGSGVVFGIVLGAAPTTGAVELFDGSTKLISLGSGAPVGAYPLNIGFKTSLKLTTADSTPVTVIYA